LSALCEAVPSATGTVQQVVENIKREFESHPSHQNRCAGEDIHHRFGDRIVRGRGYLSFSPAAGATGGARRPYLSKSLGFEVPAQPFRNSLAMRRVPAFFASAAAISCFKDTRSSFASSEGALFAEFGSFDGYVPFLTFLTP
jgi:hypothetical protein